MCVRVQAANKINPERLRLNLPQGFKLGGKPLAGHRRALTLSGCLGGHCDGRRGSAGLLCLGRYRVVRPPSEGQLLHVAGA